MLNKKCVAKFTDIRAITFYKPTKRNIKDYPYFPKLREMMLDDAAKSLLETINNKKDILATPELRVPDIYI